jgi:hypothetical protein
MLAGDHSPVRNAGTHMVLSPVRRPHGRNDVRPGLERKLYSQGKAQAIGYFVVTQGEYSMIS